jgi:DnaJ-class molecular chaperone
MAKSRDYYEVLGVSRGATADEIRTAYRTLARQLHPDVNKAPDAAKRFAEVQEAYDILADEEKRRTYDQFGHVGAGPGATARGRAGAGRRGQAQTWSTSPGGMDPEDLASIFDEFMGGAARGGFGATHAGGGRRVRPERPAENVLANVRVPFLVAVHGGTQTVRVSVDDEPGQAIEVRIPPRTESGAKLRIRGKGRPAQHGRPAGDLILTIEVEPHPFYRRQGLDLVIDLPLTIAEAALGASVRVPLLSGSAAEVRVPPSTSSGRTLRVRGQGLSDGKGGSGDLLAVVSITAPATLSEADRQVMADLATRLPNPREGFPWVDNR